MNLKNDEKLNGTPESKKTPKRKTEKERKTWKEKLNERPNFLRVNCQETGETTKTVFFLTSPSMRVRPSARGVCRQRVSVVGATALRSTHTERERERERYRKKDFPLISLRQI